MECSMLTRLAWKAFGERFASAAKDLFLIADQTDFMDRSKKNYQAVLQMLPEETGQSAEVSKELVTAVFASAVMSLDDDPTPEELQQFYSHAIGFADGYPESVHEIIGKSGRLLS